MWAQQWLWSTVGRENGLQIRQSRYRTSGLQVWNIRQLTFLQLYSCNLCNLASPLGIDTTFLCSTMFCTSAHLKMCHEHISTWKACCASSSGLHNYAELCKGTQCAWKPGNAISHHKITPWLAPCTSMAIVCCLHHLHWTAANKFTLISKNHASEIRAMNENEEWDEVPAPSTSRIGSGF